MNVDTLYSLKDRLDQIIPIESIDIVKLYEELLSFFSESLENYIERRHKELQNEGRKNKEIYSILSDEVTNQLFRGHKLSERQIKRIIYGD